VPEIVKREAIKLGNQERAIRVGARGVPGSRGSAQGFARFSGQGVSHGPSITLCGAWIRIAWGFRTRLWGAWMRGGESNPLLASQ